MNDARRSPAPPRAGRLWLFRAMAILSPLLLLLVLEGVLRLAGYGRDTAFLHRVEVDGQTYLRDNPDFYSAFFPPHLMPRQLPFTVPARKPADEIRIALLGGSAAMGIPEPAYGIAPVLEEQLRHRHPDRRIRVLNLANTAVNSHVVRRVAASLRPLDVDAVVVYLGNNEVVGPFGASDVLTPVAPSSSAIAFSLWLRSTRVGQLLQNVFGLGGSAQAPERWAGMAMFLEDAVEYDDPVLERVRAHFESNLHAMAESVEDLGVPMILATVGVNLRHCGPFASTDPAQLDADARRRFETALRTGDGLWERGVADSARVFYEEALALLPDHADLHYRLGRLVLAEGDTMNAVSHLRSAREYDTLRFRADAAANGIVRRVATRADGVVVADVEAALTAVSPASLPGREVFLEHVHLDFAGTRVTARVMADALEFTMAERLGPPVADTWLGTDELAARLAYTAWGRREVLGQTLTMLSRPPFTGQSDHLEQVDFLAAQYRALEGVTTPEALASMWPMVEASVAAAPDEWIRRFRAAQFLADGMGDPARAEDYWRGIVDEQPHFAAAINGWARAVAAQGRFPQAVRLFERSLALDPYQPDVRISLATALRRLGPNDPDTRRRAFELEEGALRLEASPAAEERLRALYAEEIEFWRARGDQDRVRRLEASERELPSGANAP